MSHKAGHKRKPTKKAKPNPKMLGSGSASKAGKAIKGRSAKLKAAMRKAGA